MRFCFARDFDMQTTFDQIVKSEEFRTKINGWSLYEHEFKELIEMKTFINHDHIRDKMGRPVIFMIARNFLLTGVSVDHL
jgi:hypothetical protein